jgi:FixJ family two-component response regulator
MSEEHPAVFVVDDDISIREALTNLLRSEGLSVETFGTAEEFLLSQRFRAHGCLVLDVRLPGLSGLDLQRQLAEAEVEIPIVFITGFDDIRMSVLAMKAGAVGFLTKPFRDQDFLDAVRQCIDRDRAARKGQAELGELRNRCESTLED